MGVKRNKTLKKLRVYRDRLIKERNEYQAESIKKSDELREAFSSLRKNDMIRAMAILSPWDDVTDLQPVKALRDVLADMTTLYMYLNIEREYTSEISRAVEQNDWLRAKALAAQHRSCEHTRDKLLVSIRELIERYGMSLEPKGDDQCKTEG